MAAQGTPSEEPRSFEQHLEALEQVVADLEGDALSLEASIARYQQGVTHLAACRRILDAAEQRLSELVSAADGSVQEKPLAVAPEGLVDAGPARPAEAPAKRAGRRKPSLPADDAGSDLPF